MKATDLSRAIIHAINAHSLKPVKPHMAFRKWDGKTPYSVHPIWCAMTLLHETSLPQDIREKGAIALLYHDILEDTKEFLPENTHAAVRQLVDDLTFENTADEMQKVWQKPPVIRLLKLYDKTSNLMDSHWMSAEKLQSYQMYTAKLIQDVEKNFGELNIVRLARSFV